MMAEDEWVDPNDWRAAPDDAGSDWVDPNLWNEKPKQKLSNAAALLVDGKSASVEGPSVWGDIGKTLGIAPVKGPIHALGTPGDVKSLIELGLDKAGVSKERREGALKGIGATPLGFMARGPTSAQVQKGVEQATGPLYESKTDWGKRVGTVANAVTNPLSYIGSASLPAKALLAGTSAAGSEVGRAAAKGTGIEALETPLSIAGGLAGGLAPAGVGAALKSKPRFDKFHEVADSQYMASRNLGIEFKPKSVFDLQKSIYDKLKTAGYRDHTAGSTYKLVGELTQGPNGTRGYLVDDIKGVKDALKMVPAGDPRNNADFSAAQLVRKEIDNFFKGAKPTDAVVNQGALADFKQMYRDAAKNWGAAENLERIDKKIVKADRQTNASDALKPYNKQRQAIEGIIDNDAVKGFYTPAQLKQMDRIISGTWPGEIGRWFGKVSPRSLWSMTAGGAGIASGMWPYTAALWGTGEAGRAVASGSTRRQIGILEDMIRRDAPAYSNQLKPSPSALGPQSRTPFPYLNELSDITGGEAEPPLKSAPKSAPKTIPLEDQKEIRKALDIARQLQGAARQSGGRVAGIEYTREELDASRREDRRYQNFLGRVAPRGIPWQKYRRTSPSNIEDRSNEGFVSEEDRRRRTIPNRPWPEVSDLSRQAGYDDIGKARGGKIKRRIPPHVTIPEPPATLKKQQQAMISGRRAAMLFPHKSSELALPRGMKRMRTKDGLVHFNKNKLTPSQIRKASNDGKMNEILEMGPVSKEEALSRAAKGERLVAVTERGSDGVEAKSALGTEQTAPAQLAALQETADPGDWVAVEPVQETLARRAVA